MPRLPFASSPLHALALGAAVAILGLLPACGRLPSGGPVREEVVSQSGDPNTDFAVYPVTRAFLPTVTHWPPAGRAERLSWLPASRGPMTQAIRPGDKLALRIWDSGDNSLLTAPGQREVTLQQTTVAPNGTVFLPYVGDVNVLGLSPDLARSELQSKIEAIVPSAQVQLEMSEGRSNSVDLVSGVARPGPYPMPDRDYSVMALIAAGGGISQGITNPQIRLMRSGHIYGTSVERLMDNPGLDARLSAGDRVFVEADTRYFLSFGATGTEAVHPFTKDDVSAMDAVAIMGGFNDNRADPKGLLILREYGASALSPGARGPRQQRVVFTVDLTSTDGLFSARNFPIQPQDLVIATESPINDALTISNLVGNFFGVFSRAGAI
ncbi:polysaccharide biosynthesis/export family protein [Chachezhania sediminis]|uniref:polysaccharide biosynthesis/export family protein n=1 Tax=Chachezhania sediminis TaxID=2599291 RepID=UPI00131B829D|nr:polysaccharide biosynthesis/export family protein [Chachezhania sediminis]